MAAKAQVKRIIGNKNTQRISLLKRSISVLFHRALRYSKSGSLGNDTPCLGIESYFVPGAQTFFGYYDVTPFSRNNELILAMAAPSKNKPPSGKDEISVGFFSRYGKKVFNHVAKTSTWCWQQGCRLQWFPEDEDELIIYNKLVDRTYGAVVQSIKTKEIVRKYDRPIYDIDRNGRWALTLNFSRLHRLRPGYGYCNIPELAQGDLCPHYDGVWLIDLNTGKAEMIITLDFLSKYIPLDSMKCAEHYINHLSFNPSGTRFMFFHMWKNNGRRYNRLITSDLDGRDLCVLEDHGIVSHYTWKSDNELLVTVYYRSGFRYQLYHDNSTHRETIAMNLLCADGHPSYSPDGSLILTDTYPDKFGEQHLLLYSPNEKLVRLFRFFSPPQFRGEVRCDLHPRWDRSGTKVCADSAQDGRRSLYVIDTQI